MKKFISRMLFVFACMAVFSVGVQAQASTQMQEGKKIDRSSPKHIVQVAPEEKAVWAVVAATLLGRCQGAGRVGSSTGCASEPR